MNSRTLEEELEKNAELKLSDLEALRNWIIGRIELPAVANSDLALFLHRNYYDVEITKLNILRYFTIRTQMPEYFADRDPFDSNLQSTFENVSVVALPTRTPEGFTIILIKLLKTNPNLYNFNQAVKYLNMVVDTYVYETGISNGYLYICDIKDATSQYFDRIPAQGLKKFFEYLTSGTHFRWMGMHYINSSSNGIVMNQCIKRKILEHNYAENVYLHEKMEDLGTVVPVKLLPNEMGGSAGRLQELHLMQIKKIKIYQTWFNVESRMRLNVAQINIDDNYINAMN